MKYLDRNGPAPLLLTLARRRGRARASAPPPEPAGPPPDAVAAPPPAVAGVPNLWTLSELVDVEGPLDDDDAVDRVDAAEEPAPTIEIEELSDLDPDAIEAMAPASEPDPETVRVTPAERDDRLADLRRLESWVPPPPTHRAPGADDVANLGGNLFPSSLPPGPMIVPLDGRDSVPPPLSEAPPEPDDDAYAALAEEPRARRIARVIGPLVAALAVAAGTLVVARGGLDRSEPTPPSVAAAGFADRAAELGRHGAPIAVAAPDAIRLAEPEPPRAAATAAPPVAPARDPRATRPVITPPPAPIAEPPPPAPTPAPPPRVDLAAGVVVHEPPPAPSPDAVADAMNAAAPPPAAPAASAFDTRAASAALAAAEQRAAHCAAAFEDREGAIGGEVAVTFAPSGRATSAIVSGPRFSGRLEGSCVARVFRGAEVPPFVGDPVTVRRRIQLR